ncbi:MAG: hypothetical protein IT293_07795 [Deltaproteobacteria bacterium]|nr:hypothetical protein [Deltaproteobacteria bacterium]
MRAAYDRSRSGVWDGAHGLLLPEIDPTDETALDVQNVTQPERRLLFAILADAIVRVRRLATAPRHAAIELREAERWIRSDDREWPCSFVNVCEALDIEPAPLRRAVLAWRRAAGGRTNVTRRTLMAKKRRRKRSAAAVAASASARAEFAAAALAASAPDPNERLAAGTNG